MRISTSGMPTDNWHHFLRLRDLQQVLAEVPLEGVTRVLELGSGDGVQTAVLRTIFPEVVPMDIAPSGDVEGMVIADVADMPFEDNYFDLVFSSNVLEHVERLDEAFLEMRRVLTPGGIMIHSMPTGTWKVIQIVLRPVASVRMIVRKLFPRISSNSGRAQTGSHGVLENYELFRRSFVQRLMGLAIPTIHGVSGNHISEFFRFRPRWWRWQFVKANFDCYRSSPLFFHSAYDLMPYRLLGLRDLIARFGFASVQVFWLR
mgnify:CR=1 FL=1